MATKKWDIEITFTLKNGRVLEWGAHGYTSRARAKADARAIHNLLTEGMPISLNGLWIAFEELSTMELLFTERAQTPEKSPETGQV